MRLWVLGIILALFAGFGYMLWHETDNLALIEQTAEKSKYTIFDTQSFVLPEPTKISKDKTTTEFYTAKQVEEAYENAKHDNILYKGFEKNIYKQLLASFGLVAFIFILIGTLVGYWLRKPIDAYDFQTLKQESKQEVDEAQEVARKARETAKNAEAEAMKQAQGELEYERNEAVHQKQEAEKERRAAIKAQQEAEAAVRKAQIERTDALRVADNATRKKNAAYSAAERFKRRLEKTA